METNLAYFKKFVLLLFALSFMFACAEKPREKIAYGEDYNLIAKSDILGAKIDKGADVKLFSGIPSPYEKYPDKVKDLLSKPNLTVDGRLIWFDIGESYLTLNQKVGEKSVAIYRYKIEGHYDLALERNKDGIKSQYLVKSTTVNKKWQDRQYVEVDPYTAKKIEADQRTLENIFAKKDISGKSFVWGKNKIPIISSNTLLIKELETTALVSVKKDDVITTSMTKDFLYFYKNKELFLQYAILDHFDLVSRKDANNEETAELEKDTLSSPWYKRVYILVDPYEPLLVRKSDDLKDITNNLILKEDLEKGDCVSPEIIKSRYIGIANVLSQSGIVIDPSEKICFEITQSVLSLYANEMVETNLLVTFDIDSHVDVTNQLLNDGKDVSSLIVRTIRNPNWRDRKYIVIATNRPNQIKYETKPNAIDKNALAGEYVYSATVIDAHSENGLFVIGQQLQSEDRLKFEFSADYLTAYKVNESLNDSGAKSPFLSYAIEQFDVERVKNGYQDATNIIGEVQDKPWHLRRFIRADFASNSIPGYFNSLLGLETSYYQSISAVSRLASEVKIENDMISFVTEEVITPVASSGFTGGGETHYEPVSIKIKHNFLKVSNRPFVAKQYDDYDFAKFGFFRVTQYGVDPQLGKTDESVKNYARLYDISQNHTIDFYLSKNFPEKYLDEVKEIEAAWNKAFKEATGREGVFKIHTENRITDISDPRVSALVYVESRNTEEPLGYGPSVFDPNTGENISGKSFIYGNSIKSVLRSVGLYYDLIHGNLSLEDITADNFTNFTPSSAKNPPSKISLNRSSSIRRDLQKGLNNVKHLIEVQGDAFYEPMENIFERLSGSTNGTIQGIRNNQVGATLIANSKAWHSHSDASIVEGKLNLHQGCAWEQEKALESAARFIQAFPNLSKEEVLAEYESRMVFATLLHEVGHNLGLRHNFKGSFDESNFPDEYWRGEMSDDSNVDEKVSWNGLYNTSSVMDYTDTFDGMYKDVGPYDIAAIKYAYGDKIEVLDQEHSSVTNLVYTDLSLSEYREQLAAIASQESGLSKNEVIKKFDEENLIRKYMFCSDEHVWEDPACNRFDRGTTIQAIAESLIDSYETGYLIHGFRRGRRLFTGSSAWVTGRYFLPLRQFLDEFIYRSVTDSFSKDIEGFIVPESRQDYLNAVIISARFFTDVLNTLEPGMYHLDKEKNEFLTGESKEEEAKNLSISKFEGKYLKARKVDVGLSEKVVSRGIEMDKASVLHVMAMRGYPANKYLSAGLQLNFFDLLNEYSFESFSAIIRDSMKIEINAVLSDDGKTYMLQSDEQSSAEVIKASIKPSTSLFIKQLATFYSMSSYNSNSDRSFGDYVDVRIVGRDDQLPVGVEAIKFRSVSGVNEYIIPQTRDGRSISYAIAEGADTDAEELIKVKKLVEYYDTESSRKVATAVGLFSQAWLIGNAKPLASDIEDSLMSDFSTYEDQILTLVKQWIEKAQEKIKKLWSSF
ncbi:MAG: zinc-dependent metalloprotease [Bdellovibrionota bacterium]